MEKRRYGRFSLPAHMVREGRWEATRIMGMCAVFRAEHMLMCDRVQYEVSCWKFRPVALGEIVPEYEWRFGDDGVECVELPH